MQKGEEVVTLADIKEKLSLMGKILYKKRMKGGKISYKKSMKGYDAWML